MEDIEEQLLVSIITTVYNGEEYLQESIESVLNQTSSAWELLLIDDGSTDKSGEICDYYANKYERISVKHIENCGHFESRIHAINMAKGVYCTCLDADDYLELNSVSIFEESIKNHPCDILAWNIRYVEDGKEISRQSLDRYGEYSREEFLECVSRTANHSFSSKLIKTELLKKSYYGNVPDSRRSMDYIGTCPAICMAESIYAIEDVLYNYRQVESSLTHVICGKRILDILNSTECVFGIVNHYGMFTEKYEKAECVCLLNTVGYEIKQAYKRSTISREEAESIRNHPVFQVIRKYEKYRYLTPDLYLVLKLFRHRGDAVLSKIYGK